MSIGGPMSVVAPRIEHMFDLLEMRGHLAAASADLRSGGSTLPLAEWVDLVGECQAVISAAQGLQTLALSHVAATQDVALEDGTVVEEFCGLGHERLDGPALVADDLGLTAQGASGRMSTAVTWHPSCPSSCRPWRRGRSTPTGQAW